MLFETETKAIPRSHQHDGQYEPTEIRILPDGWVKPLKWALTPSRRGTTYEPYPSSFDRDDVDEAGPNREFRVHRCYHLPLDPWKQFPVKVFYKKWNKDEEEDDFFLHCALVPLVLLKLVSEDGVED